MEPRAQLLQRHLDGRLDPAQHAAAQRLLADDPAAAAGYAQLERLHQRLVAHREHLPHLDPQAAAARILAALPAGAPPRQRSVSAGSIAAGLACLALAIVAGLYAGLRHDDLPGLAALGLASIVLGLVLALAPVVLRPGSPLAARLLGRRVQVSLDQKVVLTCLGIGVFVGGILALV